MFCFIPRKSVNIIWKGLPDDEEGSKKKSGFILKNRFFGPKTGFWENAFWSVTFFFVNQGTKIQIVTHPYLGRSVKKALKVFRENIVSLAGMESGHFGFGFPKSTDSQWGHLGRRW